MNNSKPSQFWSGLLAGFGIAQLYNYAVIAWQLPRLQRNAMALGIGLSPQALFFGKPAVYLGIPALVLLIFAFILFFLRRKSHWQLFFLAIVNLISWIILALMTRSAFLPLLETIHRIG